MDLKAGMLFPVVWLIIMVLTELVVSELARRGTVKPTLRKLAPVEAIDEAISRSTEMGRPIHFSTGYGTGIGVRDRPILAGLGVLQLVAQRCAENGIPLINTCAFGEIIPVADEAMREGARRAGKPEWYNPNYNRFLSQERYSYSLGVVEILETERPGASFLIGNFWMEALILSEPGAALNIMQISGTTEFAALPFLIASTDYVLISPEIYSASAYITGDKLLTGAFFGEDLLQTLTYSMLILGFILALVGTNLFVLLGVK